MFEWNPYGAGDVKSNTVTVELHDRRTQGLQFNPVQKILTNGPLLQLSNGPPLRGNYHKLLFNSSQWAGSIRFSAVVGGSEVGGVYSGRNSSFYMWS